MLGLECCAAKFSSGPRGARMYDAQRALAPTPHPQEWLDAVVIAWHENFKMATLDPTTSPDPVFVHGMQKTISRLYMRWPA
jgi:hypothetical protein